MGRDMAEKFKQGSKSAKRRGKRRRWRTARPNPPPELILPPVLRAALGLKPAHRHWFVATDRALAALHRRHDAGDRSALLDAIEVLSHNFPVWVRDGFLAAWWRYCRYDVATLDEAFGVERRKGQHLAPAQKRELLRPQVILEVYCRHAKGEPLDQGTFDRVGDELNISGSEVAKIFSEPESDGLRELVRNLQISD
jgi:hypothetical protein